MPVEKIVLKEWAYWIGNADEIFNTTWPLESNLCCSLYFLTPCTFVFTSNHLQKLSIHQIENNLYVVLGEKCCEYASPADCSTVL